MVEDVVVDSARAADSARGVATHKPVHGVASAPQQGSGRVLGWQEMILNLNAICDQCNGILPKGQRAAIAITEFGGTRPIICPPCLAALSDADKEVPS